MGTGKHSALKQSSDGSFELVVSEEIDVPPEETSLEELSDPGRTPEPEPAGGWLKWAVLAAVLVGVAGVVALVAFGGEDDARTSDDDEPIGFKPYVGEDGKSAESAIVPVEPVRPSKPARRAVPDDDEVEGREEMAEVTDDAWEVDENGQEIVESEEIPPDFVDQVVETEEGVEIEPERDGTRFVNPSTLKNIRERLGQDIEVRKSLHELNLESAPQLRPTRINPGNAIGPAGTDEITVIEEDELEEMPVDEDYEGDE